MATLVDGKKIAYLIKEKIAKYTQTLKTKICFDIIYVGSDPVIDTFIKYKQKFGNEVGIEVSVHNFDETISQNELEKQIQMIAEKSDAMIVQLPLPEHLDQQTILDIVPAEIDADVLGNSARTLFKRGTGITIPPVTGSIVQVFDFHTISLDDKKIVIVGNGSLVGYPMSLWLDIHCYTYDVITLETIESEKQTLLKNADVVISGAGVPHIITRDMLKNDVVLIDAGTSESGKKVVGDIHPDCANAASLMTPVPGGIGPITIAVLYQNIINLYKHNRHA